MKYIAMFLPQFHQCEYNSRWWGEGFTEWDNVRKATPLFVGHRQPRTPGDGFFDLGTASEIARQADQARSYGISAFSIYHYWYEGRRPLSKPLDIILQNPNLEIEFSLCWANHSWTRSWSNRSGSLDVLIEQTYENDEFSREKHFQFLSNVFADSRYTNIQGKPLFQIYMPEAIPGCAEFLLQLRTYVRMRTGLEIFISAMIKSWRRDWEYLTNFDAVTLFQPSLALFSPSDIFGSNGLPGKNFIESRIRDSPLWLRKVLYSLQDVLPSHHSLYDYESTWENLLNQYGMAISTSPRPTFPMGFIDFDNTPRYNRRAKLFEGFSTAIFERKMRKLNQLATNNSPSEIVFINAWNEWGEGMYLQPENTNDYSRLIAVRNSAVQ